MAGLHTFLSETKGCEDLRPLQHHLEVLAELQEGASGSFHPDLVPRCPTLFQLIVTFSSSGFPLTYLEAQKYTKNIFYSMPWIQLHKRKSCVLFSFSFCYEQKSRKSFLDILRDITCILVYLKCSFCVPLIICSINMEVYQEFLYVFSRLVSTAIKYKSFKNKGRDVCY